MNPTLTRAVIVVTCALACYSLGVITEQRSHRITGVVLGFLSVGVLLDISSTTLMIIGSRRIPITFHGFIGYSALAAMLLDTILVWRFRTKKQDEVVPRGLNLYTRLAYSWWVVAYIAGAVIAMTLKT